MPAHAPPPSKGEAGEEVIERSDLFKRWQQLRPPLRPHESDVARLASLTAAAGTSLLLGVTPELAGLARPVVAVDWSDTMIARIWPGDTTGRHAVQANWLAMPFDAASFGACIGDGAINMLLWPDENELLVTQLRYVVRQGGRIALRTFCSPDTPESLRDLHTAAFAGDMGFHAFKWRLAQAAMVAHNIEVRSVWQAFEATFPDRDALSAATGWPLAAIAEIDDYAASTLSKCFPTRAMLTALFPDARFEESQGYELADRCPVLVIDL